MLVARKTSRVLSEPWWIRWPLISVAALLFFGVLVAPLLTIFIEAFEQGWQLYLTAVTDPEAWSAIQLTLWVALIAVPLNTVFGIFAAWMITKFDFRGKDMLLTVIDLPFSVSPVVAGLMFVLLFGAHGWFGHWLQENDIQVIFALPGIVLATIFITLPYVVRELVPLMQAQGRDEEEAAMTLGASGWKMFWKITLPNIKWALINGIILCNARAMGEFGAVSVVSGHIRGETNTLPLHVEILHNEYQFAAAFACASLLTVLALLTLLLTTVIESRRQRSEAINASEAATDSSPTLTSGRS